MNVHMYKSRTFQRTVLYYTAIFLIPIMIFSYISIKDIIEENNDKIITMYNADAQRISKAIDVKMNELMHIGNRLYHSRWVTKLSMNIDYSDREFTQIRKQEISRSLRNDIVFTGVLSNIAILFPHKDLVISPEGWYTMDGYFSGILKIQGEDTDNICKGIKDYGYFEVIGDIEGTAKGSGKGELVAYQSLEISRTPRAALIYFIDRQKLQSYIRDLSLPSLIDVTILEGKDNIYQEVFVPHPKEAEGETMICSAVSGIAPWEYTYTYKDSSPIISAEQLFSLSIGIILSLLAGFIVAIILAAVTYKPLYNLIYKIFKYDKGTGGVPKVAFGEYNAIETSYTDLLDKNEDMRRRINDYEGAAKNNLLLRLLKGYFDDSKLFGKLTEIGLSYSNEDYFSVILIHIPYNGIDSVDNVFLRKQSVIKSLIAMEKAIEGYDVGYENVDALDDTFALIINLGKEKGEFSKGDSANPIDGLFSDIKEHIENAGGMEILMAKGNVEKGIIGISKSYQMARDALDYMLFDKDEYRDVAIDALYYYPTDWEIQLINNLKVGDGDTVRRIIHEMRLENEERDLPKGSIIMLISLVVETQMRVLDELNIDSTVYNEEYKKVVSSGDIDRMWEYLYETGQRICDRNRYANSIANIGLANDIINYIDENYNDPDLSLTRLSEIFHMSTSSLSKLFKGAVGINYSEYLSRTRMEHAKALLKETEKNICDIACEVGYDNEHSFRRAFRKYEGINPSEYAGQS